MNIRTRAPHGIALVIVLAFLVLISGITLAFFSGVTTQLSFSKSAATGATTQQLADSTVNVAMAQIVDGTKGMDSAGKNLLAWASQPGMIRSFNASGSKGSFYKLYSSDEMVVDGTLFSPEKDVPGSDWSKRENAGLYTDLNAPVLINDANGLVVPDPARPTDKFTAVYPILDPRAEGTVEGFWLNDRPGSVVQGAYSEDSSDPTRVTGTDNTANPAPMPVKWLYLLRDGKLAAPTAGGTGIVNVNGATKDNPITGRIAFWADDDSCKVNINTASEGTYWDVPRVYSMEDFGQLGGGGSLLTPGLAVSQPGKKEFQRYPGHPATTSLSPIFGSVLPSPVVPSPGQITRATAARLEPYYALAPRVSGGGSLGGTDFPTKSKIKDKRDRLYASFDELMFKPELSGNARVPNTANGSAEPNAITRGLLEKARFFTTATSSAPEVTLYNTPRIAMWPIPKLDGPANRSAHDRLAAFCSTVGNAGKPSKDLYHFTRSDSRSPTVDFSPRNRDLYAYLQAMTTQPIPGFGPGNFLGKYGADRDQILTYIYDYIRCTNLQDSTTAPYTKPYRPQELGAGEVVPIRINSTQGFGRFYSISEADIVFFGTAKIGNTDKSSKMKAMLLLEFASPMQGLGAMRSGLKYTVRNLEKLEVKFGPNGAWTPLGFRKDATNGMDTADLDTFHGRSVGGTEGPFQAVKGKEGNYAFLTPLDIDSPTDDFSFRLPKSDKEVDKVSVEVRTSNGSELIQTIRLDFPETVLRRPRFSTDFAKRFSDVFSLVRKEDTVVGLEPAGIKENTPFEETDSSAGDTRMVEGLEVVPSRRFRPHNLYTKKDPNTGFSAHGLLSAVGEKFTNATFGTLVPVQSYRQANSYNTRQPDVPSRVGKAVTRADGKKPGDWDTGFGDQKDGAYINKPDEGDTELNDPAGSEPRIPYLLGFGKGFASAKPDYFSPSRQVPSAMMLGSIPTGVQRLQPWQTLLFHPRPEDTEHPGRQSPPDHLLADLFWMPVVEPYAISQPFSTAGKINMNYQILPFSYIRRDTGLRAVMKGTKFLAIELADSLNYKPIDPGSNGKRIPPRRQSIDLPTDLRKVPETFKMFDKKFNEGEIFKSATQICEMNLIPKGFTESTMIAFWKKHELTGDNVKEKPYVDIYPRLTTKSNVYTVHVRVQTLKKSLNSAPDVFIDPETRGGGAKDLVMGEYRGSTTIERYIDLNDPNLPDFAKVSFPPSPEFNMDRYYRFRVVGTKRFAP